MQKPFTQLPTARGEDIVDTKTVLIIFVVIVIIMIYLISLLLIVIRRAKKLIQLRNRKYYLAIAFYISTKMVLCTILIMEIIVGISNSWKNLVPSEIQLIIKTGLVFADFSIVEMFLVSLETYFVLCLSTITDISNRKRAKMMTFSLKILQIIVILVLLIPLILFNVNDLSYNVLNSLSIGINSFIILSFLLTLFYLNFKMTGIMMQTRLNQVIKRIFKVQMIILVSRAFMICFQILVADFVPDSFESYIETVSQNLEYEVILGLLFIGSVVLILLTEGLPVMYSLRSSVMQALNFKSTTFQYKQSIFTDTTSDLQQSMLDKQDDSESQIQLRLKSFHHLTDERPDKEDSIWICKKGTYQNKQYLIRISKHQISSYIFEDIENELAMWSQANIISLSKISYFCEGQIIHLVEKYYYQNLDLKIQEIYSQTELLRVALNIAQAIGEFHQKDIVHGCLSPQHIFFDGSQIILNGLGLHSLRKYLSLITGYTNKTIYTAVQHLKDRNNIILKAKKPADIYSFGIILYQIVTKNRQYRQLPLQQIQAKFAQQNFRPKLPEQIKSQIKNLIRRCWNEIYDKRPTIGEVIQNLRKLI